MTKQAPSGKKLRLSKETLRQLDRGPIQLWTIYSCHGQWSCPCPDIPTP